MNCKANKLIRMCRHYLAAPETERTEAQGIEIFLLWDNIANSECEDMEEDHDQG